MIATPRRRTKIAGLLMALSACGGPSVFLRQPDQPRTWPPDPESARIALVLAYGGTSDVERHPGFWNSLGNLLLGGDDHSLLSPAGLSLQAPDVLWVADPGLAAVHRIDMVSGEHTIHRGTAEEPMQTPIGVAPGPDGGVFVSDSSRSRILVLSADGDLLRAFGNPTETGRPTGIAWDAERGRLLVADTTGCRLLAYSGDGKLLQVAGERGGGPGQFNFPTHLALSRDGRVFVVDSMNFRVQVLGPDLVAQSAFGEVGRGPGCFAMPKGIALDSEGHVYVVDGLFENVQIFAADGQLLLAFGGHGKQLGDLDLPGGIWIDATDRIYVGDSGHGRIQVYRYLRR
jgi:sugar lactone lactonase YvrE